MKKVFSLLCIAVCIAVSLSSCAQNISAPAETVTVTDMVGRTVSVPASPQKICGLDPFTAPVIVMLGFGDRMPATVNNVIRDTLIKQMCPELNNAVSVKSSGSMNSETILELGCDLIFLDKSLYENPDEKVKLDMMGIPYVVTYFSNMEEQMQAVKTVGAALGASEEAEKYIEYYSSCIERVSEDVKDIPQSDLPRVYHSLNEAVRTDYPGSMPADWISVTRCINVSLESDIDISTGKAYATLEQIYAWEPEIIICNESGVADYILSDSKWMGLSAVQNGTVYQMPVGVTRWGHPNSVETPLALLWLDELLYPDKAEVDIRREMADFYLTFFDFQLTDETADAILDGSGIRTEKTENKFE